MHMYVTTPYSRCAMCGLHVYVFKVYLEVIKYFTSLEVARLCSYVATEVTNKLPVLKSVSSTLTGCTVYSSEMEAKICSCE